MPKYVVFLLVANRPEASKTNDDNDNELSSDPEIKKVQQEFLSWIEAENKAERVKGSEFLLDSSEETNIRVDFHDPDTKPEAKVEENDSGPAIPSLKSSVTRGHQPDMSTNILCYFTVEFSEVKEVIAWAQSCPLAYSGFALEIRELKGTEASISEAPAEVKEWAGDQIVFTRKRLFEQGKMKKDEDGTLWFKVEDEEGVKEIVVEAEKREEQNEAA